MKLIVGTMNPKMKQFIKDYNFNDKILVISKMCNVKTIKGPVEVIIPFGRIGASGLINNTLVHLEELIMSVNVVGIKYGNISNNAEMKRISALYQIPVSYIDINNLPRKFLI